MDFELSAKTQSYLERVQSFMREHIEPVEMRYWNEILDRNNGGDWTRWTTHPLLEELKAKAKAQGLWNMFLPDEELGCGLTTLEYAPIAEALGRSMMASEVFNCSAPDTGNA